MMKIDLKEYLRSPCSASSLPYWKSKQIQIPSDILVVHDKDYKADIFQDYKDERYFRLYNDLSSIDSIERNKDVCVEYVSEKTINDLVDTINISYDYLKVTKEQILLLQKTPVYDSRFWILLKEKHSNDYVGSGIADFDPSIGELIIEWIQVAPVHRRKGYGTLIVNFLLNEAKGIVKFATVSGKVDDQNMPERLYRKCGFVGNDIWHILHRCS